ncbi:hypothetical protein DFH06DRAFT_1189809, partial [Mycena polygramma]
MEVLFFQRTSITSGYSLDHWDRGGGVRRCPSATEGGCGRRHCNNKSTCKRLELALRLFVTGALFTSRTNPDCGQHQRAKHCKEDAQVIALRTVQVMRSIKVAVPTEGSIIPPAMLESIGKFTAVLKSIRHDMELITRMGRLAGVLHLNRNETSLRRMKSSLDNAYRDFLASSIMRLEVEQSNAHDCMRELSADSSAAMLRVEVQLEKLSGSTNFVTDAPCHVPEYSAAPTVPVACPRRNPWRRNLHPFLLLVNLWFLLFAHGAEGGEEKVACIVGSLYPHPIYSSKINRMCDTKPMQETGAESVEGECALIFTT